jgi:hypothetical protein
MEEDSIEASIYNKPERPWRELFNSIRDVLKQVT